MKVKTILYAMVLVIIGSCTTEKKSPIEGTWKIVSWEYMWADTLLWKYPRDFTGSEMVIYSKGHFLWVGHYNNDTTAFDNYGGGTYKLDGNHLEENILYSEAKSWVGTTIKLLWELKNDTAIQTFTCDDNWQPKKGDYAIQKWIRVK